jgi:hypothetical protein
VLESVVAALHPGPSTAWSELRPPA